MSAVGGSGRRRAWVVVGLLLVGLGLLAIGLSYLVYGLDVAAAVAGLLAVLPTVVAIVVGLLRWSRRAVTPAPAESAAVIAAAEVLAKDVDRRWGRDPRLTDLDKPYPIPVPWSLSTRTGVMDRLDQIGVESFDASSGMVGDLATQFRKLSRPRLVVLGGAGAGKSTLALQLLLALLASRPKGGPVPVLVSLSGWDPNATPGFHDWLPTRLDEDYPSLRGSGATRALVDDGDVLPVLDGLDEVPAASRAAILTALDDSLTERDQFVLTSRTEEFVEAVRAAGRPLTKTVVIEPAPVRPDVAVQYLRALPRVSPPTGWKKFLRSLEGAGVYDAVLVEALGTPLDLWLLGSTYDSPDDDLRELLDRRAFPSAAAVRGHLFDKLIPRTLKKGAAGLRFLGLPRHRDPAKVRRWLEQVAVWTALMDPPGVAHIAGRRFGTRAVPVVATADGFNRDFRWWQLPEGNLPDRILRRVYAWGGTAIGATTGLLAGPQLASGAGMSPWEGALGFASVFAMLGFVMGGGAYVLRRRRGRDRQPAPLYVELRAARQIGRLVLFVVVGVLVGAALGAVVGPLAALLAAGWERVFGAQPAGYSGGLAGNVVRWSAAGAVLGAAVSCSLAVDNSMPDGPAATPDASWRGARTASVVRLVASAVGGAGFGAVVLFGEGQQIVAPGIVLYSLLGLLIGAFTSSRAWATAALTTAWWARRRLLPLRLMAFLRDAHQLGLMRTIGSVYQFRHAAFQDHLVAAWLKRQPPVTVSAAEQAGAQTERESESLVPMLVGALVTALAISTVQLIFFTPTAAEKTQRGIVAGLALLGLAWIAVRRLQGKGVIPAPLHKAARRLIDPPPQ